VKTRKGKEIIELLETYYDDILPPPLKDLYKSIDEIDEEKLTMRLNNCSYKIQLFKQDIIERYDGLFDKDVRSIFSKKFATTPPLIFAELIPMVTYNILPSFYLCVFTLNVTSVLDFAKRHDPSLIYPVYLCYRHFEKGTELLEKYKEEEISDIDWNMQKISDDFKEFIEVFKK
jgi:hypothetical protein